MRIWITVGNGVDVDSGLLSPLNASVNAVSAPSMVAA